MVGLLVSTMLVIAACSVVLTIDRHAEQHGHDCPAALFDFESVQRLEVRAKRQVGDGRHGCMVAQPSTQKHVRGGRS